MRKFYLPAILLIAIHLNAIAQPISQSISHKKDSLKIDSIKKTLLQLKTINRIESMILICEYYNDNLRNKSINAADSIRWYGSKVLNESKTLNYKRGIAMGLMATAPDSLKEKRAQEAMQIGKQIGDNEVLGWATLILNTNTDVKQIDVNNLLAMDYFNKAGKVLRATYLNTWLCQGYLAEGENEKAFDCARENLDVLKKIQSPEFNYIYTQSLLWNYWNMAYIFRAAGDYEEALKYLQKSAEVGKGDNTNENDWSFDIYDMWAERNQYDSALFYWNRGIKDIRNWSEVWRPGQKLINNGRANLYRMNKEYDKAIKILKENIVYFDSLLLHTKGNYYHAGDYGKMTASITLSAIYDSLKNYNASLKYAKDGIDHARSMNRRPEMMQAYQLLANAYHHLNNNDSAYTYLEKYLSLKDSIQTKQFLLRIYNSKKEAEDERKKAQIGLLNKDNKLKEQQLIQQTTEKKFFIAVLIALLLSGIFVFRNLSLKRKNEKLQREQLENNIKVQQLEHEKKQTELQQQAAELEMQALRAQMNPHFIFNCLSSINRFILKNESKTASTYLTRFSRLMRMVLQNSQKKSITLEDELQMLRLYLEMERLRFKNSFDYSITFLNEIDADNIFIPPLILQPFCENAIWHGLMHKEGQGLLSIDLKIDEGVLNCIISDNGIGRENAEKLKSKTVEKQKSFGLQITAERLALLNKNKQSAFYEIEDMKNENGNATGTKVNVKISIAALIAPVVLNS